MQEVTQFPFLTDIEENPLKGKCAFNIDSHISGQIENWCKWRNGKYTPEQLIAYVQEAANEKTIYDNFLHKAILRFKERKSNKFSLFFSQRRATYGDMEVNAMNTFLYLLFKRGYQYSVTDEDRSLLQDESWEYGKCIVIIQ